MNQPVVPYNTEAKRETIEQFGDEDNGFVIRWRVLDHWADFAVFQKIGHVVHQDGTKGPHEFAKKDWRALPEDSTESIDEAEEYMSGFIKWDGCAELELDQHWCGPEAWQTHIALLEHLWHTAFELMGKPLPSKWANPLDAL
jgi:hypothetical protein